MLLKEAFPMRRDGKGLVDTCADESLKMCFISTLKIARAARKLFGVKHHFRLHFNPVLGKSFTWPWWQQDQLCNGGGQLNARSCEAVEVHRDHNKCA